MKDCPHCNNPMQIELGKWICENEDCISNAIHFSPTTTTSPTPRTDADMIRIQCISLQALANNRLERGDKTIHDEIIGAIVTIRQLETELALKEQYIERMKLREESAVTQLETALRKNTQLREELEKSRDQTAQYGMDADKLTKQLTKLHEIAKGLAEALKQPYPADGSKDEAALTAYNDFLKENK